jgi:DNA-directed RNA polymerase sigma subunit (sigma70/sigma32)
MGYSRERIRQLQHQAFNKLRTLDRGMALTEYLEME